MDEPRMIEPELEDGIPLPPIAINYGTKGVYGPKRQFLAKMKVGQSFEVYGLKDAESWKKTCTRDARETGRKYSSRKDDRKAAVWRIWRVR